MRILKNLQESMAEHSKRLDRIEKSLEDILDGMVTALGLATHANVRHESTDTRLDELNARIARLEKKR